MRQNRNGDEEQKTPYFEKIDLHEWMLVRKIIVFRWVEQIEGYQFVFFRIYWWTFHC